MAPGRGACTRREIEFEMPDLALSTWCPPFLRGHFPSLGAHQRMYRKSTYALLYLLLACAITVGLGSMNIPTELDLALHANMADGVIIKLSCEQHATVIYRIDLNGRHYVGQDQTRDDDCGRVRLNDRVAVWYLPDHPETNTLRVPSGALENELISVALAATVLPAVVLWVAAARLRRRKRRG